MNLFLTLKFFALKWDWFCFVRPRAMRGMFLLVVVLLVGVGCLGRAGAQPGDTSRDVSGDFYSGLSSVHASATKIDGKEA